MLGSQEMNGTGSDVNISQTESRKEREEKTAQSPFAFLFAVRHK